MAENLSNLCLFLHGVLDYLNGDQPLLVVDVEPRLRLRLSVRANNFHLLDIGAQSLVVLLQEKFLVYAFRCADRLDKLVQLVGTLHQFRSHELQQLRLVDAASSLLLCTD